MNDIINEIMKDMEFIEYGFKDKNGNNILTSDYETWNNNFSKFYYLQTPKELLKTKCGVCWDQVELERQLFKNNKIGNTTYFIYINDNENLPSHTFLTYNLKDKFYWFEHSWHKYKGIHSYNNQNDLLLDIKNKFADEYGYNFKSNYLMIYEYKKPPKHIQCFDFYRYIKTQKLIKLN